MLIVLPASSQPLPPEPTLPVHVPSRRRLLVAFVALRLGSVRIFWLGMLLVGCLLIVLARLTSFPVALAVAFLIGIPLASLNTVFGP